MALTQGVYSVGTATTTVVAPTNDVATYVLKNLEPKGVDQLARDGHVFLAEQVFTITSGATVSFSLLTNSTGMQFEFYSITSATSNVYAELKESPTVVTTGSNLPAYNLNRNVADTFGSVLKAATSVTGGTVISAELVTVDKAAGGSMSSSKVHTLKPNTQYSMSFTNQGNQDTKVFFQLGFAEKYNGYSTVWLGTVGNSFPVRAGEEIRMTLLPLETINATALVDGVQLAVIRQE